MFFLTPFMFLEEGVKGLTAGGHFSEIFLSKENVSASLMGVNFSTQILMYKMLTLVYFPPSTTRGYRTKKVEKERKIWE